jgi:hypothetical protein
MQFKIGSKEDNSITEVAVTKDPNAKYTGMPPWFGFEATFRRGFFSVNP